MKPQKPQEPPRRRGRPSGKNRAPLSQVEKRARNAMYERQRRAETTEAMNNLAEAADCDPNLSNADLLATVIHRLRRASQMDPADDIPRLRRINDTLMMQINILEERLGIESSHEELSDDEDDNDETQPRSNLRDYSGNDGSQSNQMVQ